MITTCMALRSVIRGNDDGLWRHAVLGSSIAAERSTLCRCGEITAITSDGAIVTIDEVLVEALNLVAERGAYARKLASEGISSVLEDAHVIVYEQSRRTLLDGLDLYRRRADKGYSLVDCISMNTMRRFEITNILTDDHHFEQEGFTILLPRVRR